MPKGKFHFCSLLRYFQTATNNIHKCEIIFGKFSYQIDSVDITNATLDAIQWADGILLVYSITDRQSFNYIKCAKIEIPSDIPVSLVGNKVDMIHLRQVSPEEGDILAKDFDCKFSELSAAEHVIQVADAFHDLCREVLCARRKSKQSLLDRMLSGTRVYARGKSDSALPKDSHV